MFSRKHHRDSAPAEAPVRRPKVEAIKHSGSADAAWDALFNNGATKAEQQRALREMRSEKRGREVRASASRPGRDSEMGERLENLFRS
jgi:hypothetical protein